MASNNMYRVGDYVYFETSAGAPYQIRKIEELNKTTTGAVEAKVVCFYRRRDEPVHDLLTKTNDLYNNSDSISEKDQHLLKHRELFISRQLETLPATHIRGKAHVLHLCDNENVLDILNSDNTFFYKYVYDPVNRSLHTGKGNIRIGSNYQTEVSEFVEKDKIENDDTKEFERETLKWNPHNDLPDEDINNFITVCRSLGTYARACDISSAVKSPNLSSAAATASRDITSVQAYDVLHKANYKMTKAMTLVTPNGNPILVRDEMESWSASEAKLFEEGLGKCGKYFHQIRSDFLPWKPSNCQLVEFYYMWKTSQHYMHLKRVKNSESEHKLKQVYIPNYTKPNPSVLYTDASTAAAAVAVAANAVAVNNTNNTTTNNSNSVINSSTNSNIGNTVTNSTSVTSSATGAASATSVGCESCGNLTSGQWFLWGTATLPCKLCENCWTYWKRYGGLKNPATQDKQSKDSSSSGLNANSNLVNNNNINNCSSSSSSNSSTLLNNGNNNSAIFINKTITTHLYQCPQIGCDKQFRQVIQLQSHVTASHPDIFETLGSQWSSLEEYKNQKNGFIMKSTPELIVGRRVLKKRIRNNIRLARCFKKDKRYQLATKSLTRFQLKSLFNQFMKKPNTESINKQYRLRNFNSLHNVIERIKKLKKISSNCNGDVINNKINHQDNSHINETPSSHNATSISQIDGNNDNI